MPDATDQRPPVAIGHVRFNVTNVGAASRWLAAVGLRTSRIKQRAGST